jgi:hypothetical protein
MNKLLSAAAVACAVLAAAPALAQQAIGYQDTINNKVTVVPVTPAKPLPATADLGATAQTALDDIRDAVQLQPTYIPPIQPTADTTLGVAPAASSSAEACHVFKASAGTAYSLSGYIGAAGFIMVFDAASAPSDGAVTPKVWAYAAAAGTWSMDFGVMPAAFSTGIVVCASSTGPLSKTAYSTNTVFSGRVK